MLKKFVTILGGDPNKKALSKSNEVVDQINSLEAAVRSVELGRAAGQDS